MDWFDPLLDYEPTEPKPDQWRDIATEARNTIQPED